MPLARLSLAFIPILSVFQRKSLAAHRVLLGFFFVAETDEISNFDLIRDLDKLTELIELLF